MQASRSYRWYWAAGIAAFFAFLFLIKAVLLPFVVGMMAAYFLDPVADWLERRKLSRTAATAVITALFFTLTPLAIAGLAPVLWQQFTALLHEIGNFFAYAQQEYLPKLLSYIDSLGDGKLEQAQEAVSGISANMAGVTAKFVTRLLASGAALLNLLSLLFITPVVTFYLLRDWDRMIARIGELLPRAHADTIIAQAQEIDRTLAGFLRGQLNACLLLGIFYAITLTLAGLKYSVIIGLMAGLLIIIPYVGTFASGVVAVGVAYAQFDDFTRTLIVLGIFIAGQILESNFITPKLVGDKVGLHPVWLIFGMLVGGALFGFVGILLAVPVTAVIGVLVRFALSRYLESGLYRGRG